LVRLSLERHRRLNLVVVLELRLVLPLHPIVVLLVGVGSWGAVPNELRASFVSLDDLVIVLLVLALASAGHPAVRVA